MRLKQQCTFCLRRTSRLFTHENTPWLLQYALKDGNTIVAAIVLPRGCATLESRYSEKLQGHVDCRKAMESQILVHTWNSSKTSAMSFWLCESDITPSHELASGNFPSSIPSLNSCTHCSTPSTNWPLLVFSMLVSVS